MASENSGAKRVTLFKSRPFQIGAVVIVLLLIGGGIYWQVQHQQSLEAQSNPQQANAQKTQEVVASVGKLIVLPQNETPQIATVSDASKLKSQSFFAQAQNGDVVLIYTKAQKAILYDPNQNKIIEVGPINISQATPTPNAAAVNTPLKVALYNGTSVTGLSTTTEKDLQTKMPNVTVISKGNAGKSTYTKTLVIDLTGKQAAGASALAQQLNGEVSPLPQGETKPAGADILVILGR